MLIKYHNNNGFTILELMIVIGMVGILAGVVVPNFLSGLPNQRLKAAARDIHSTFQRAKLEAVKENESVVIFFSPAAYTAAGGVGSYQLFVNNDPSAPEDMVIDGGEPILATIAMPKGVSLISASFTDGVDTFNAAGFNGRGLPAESDIGSVTGNIQLRTSNRWYRISLSIAGNVTMEKSGDGGITWSK